MVESMNKNYVTYNEEKTDILNVVDNHYKGLAVELGAVEYHIPALIHKNILEKCGYFSSFPQHLTLASYIQTDYHNNVASSKTVEKEYIGCGDYYLTPAACLHIYPMLEGKTIDSKIITTRARVYRYENNQFDGLTRLWDFTVREIIFIGNRNYVHNMLEQMKQKTLDMTKNIKLSCNISLATDNFYPTKRNNVKEKIQKSNSMKYELITSINNRETAIASFNYHDTHFSKAFNFHDQGNIVTGCVGYGLERWVSAIEENQISIRGEKNV